jgi:hypothetical protein
VDQRRTVGVESQRDRQGSATHMGENGQFGDFKQKENEEEEEVVDE